MYRAVILFLLLVSALAVSAQVQTVGDVSFAVPDGWQYKPRANFRPMTLSAGQNFWFLAVFSQMPSSGNPENDLLAPWQKIVLAGPDYHRSPPKPWVGIGHSVGHCGELGHGAS